MNHRRYFGLFASLVLVSACSPQAQDAATTQAQDSADVIFVNGKVLTVDADFSTVEAVAVSGNQVSAVGTTAEIESLAGAATRVVDLEGRTLIPGLIDNHNHLLFNSPTWPQGVRLGRVRTRAEALERIAAKAREIGPGDGPEHIVFAIGGWNPVQFTDDQSQFTREELDAIAPDNPVYTQIS
ncbi:MAG: amidohydrolase family protein, partial [Gammaproteobacteria bacterium]